MVLYAGKYHLFMPVYLAIILYMIKFPYYTNIHKTIAMSSIMGQKNIILENTSYGKYLIFAEIKSSDPIHVVVIPNNNQIYNAYKNNPDKIYEQYGIKELSKRYTNEYSLFKWYKSSGITFILTTDNNIIFSNNVEINFKTIKMQNLITFIILILCWLYIIYLGLDYTWMRY